MGLSFIHGTRNNPLLDLAIQTKTAYGNGDDDFTVFAEHGHALSSEDSRRLRSLTEGIIEAAFDISRQKCQELNPATSLHEYLAKTVKETLPDTETDYEDMRKIVTQLSETWGSFVGGSTHRQSLKYLWLEESIEGDNIFCGGTFSKILSAIAGPALASADLRLNSKVVKIIYSQHHGQKVQVRIDGGESFHFDNVVVTAPLGWLKHNQNAFEPRLPKGLSQAINSVAYGCLEKVYLTCGRLFWLAATTHGWTTRGTSYWIHPKYARESNPRGWPEECVELASLVPESSQPTLLFYVFSDQAKHITTQVAALSKGQDKMEFLYDFFKPYYARLPNYVEQDATCHPIDSIATWLNDALSGFGSYCNFQIGIEDADNHIRTMREGLPNSRLWLAGEHTSPLTELGTATGAYLSGEKLLCELQNPRDVLHEAMAQTNSDGSSDSGVDLANSPPEFAGDRSILVSDVANQESGGLQTFQPPVWDGDLATYSEAIEGRQHKAIVHW
ncbi:hypothetical protein FDECE_10474 [Fusarium decemcellulare]|nr:hypothetical protein FDECE_10474 [Fusarium decemcellulare]